MCSICGANEALRPEGMERDGYVLRAKGRGPELKPCKYQIKRTVWKFWPKLWLETEDLAGTVADLGFDRALHTWSPRTLRTFKTTFGAFEKDYEKTHPPRPLRN